MDTYLFSDLSIYVQSFLLSIIFISFSNLKIVTWNCFSFRNKVEQIRSFLQREKPDVMGFNEIKLSTAEANLYINFDGYISLVRLREKNGDKGGGVVILVKSSLQFTQDLTFDVYQRELLAIRILGKNKKSLLFVCLYNPPKSDLSKELFHSIAGQRDEWVVMGDLNSKLISLGYETSDDKGLEYILLETNGLVLNSLDLEQI